MSFKSNRISFEWRKKKMKQTKIALLMCTLLIMGAILPLVLANVPLTTRYDDVGHYSMIETGVGLKESASGDITVDFPGTVVVAYLYWACVDVSPGGDDTIDFDSTTVTADFSYGPEPWYGDYCHYVYIEDVTNLVTGPGTYTVEGMETVFYRYGAGLAVVYEDPSLPEARLVLLDGLDAFWFDWTTPLGPNSEVASIEFPSETTDRNVDTFLFVGGTEHDDRPNEIWTETGTGTAPEDLITSPTSPGGPYPLVGGDGASWDTYTEIVEVPAGDEWLGVQVESIESWETPGDEELNGRGTSALLITAGFVLPVDRLDGLSPGFWKHNIRVALEYPGSYSVPHECEPRMDYDTILHLAEIATGQTGTAALEAALDALTTRGLGGDAVRLDMANAFNDAAGYTPYYD
jgi:hypothetical protein